VIFELKIMSSFDGEKASDLCKYLKMYYKLYSNFYQLTQYMAAQFSGLGKSLTNLSTYFGLIDKK